MVNYKDVVEGRLHCRIITKWHEDLGDINTNSKVYRFYNKKMQEP